VARPVFLAPPVDELLHELVELRRTQDSCRDRALERRPLVRDLRGAVAAREAVRANDRDHNQPLDARMLSIGLQVPGRGGEELGLKDEQRGPIWTPSSC
jgi:hypothetical protein